MGKSTIVKLVTSRSVVLFPPVRLRAAAVGSYSRFINTKSCRENDCDYNYNLKIRGRSTPQIRDLYNQACCHRLSATRNLTRLLNLMDERIFVKSAPCGYPRWDVTQDATAIYMFRNMLGLPKQGVNEFVDYDCLGSLHVFGCVRVYYNGGVLQVIVGKKGPDPGAAYEGYMIRINSKPEYCRPRKFEIDVQNEVLKITIPKEEGKWFHTFTIEVKLFRPE